MVLLAVSPLSDQDTQSNRILEVTRGDPLPPLLCVMCEREFAEDSEDVFRQVFIPPSQFHIPMHVSQIFQQT